ncbi:hypothetical protein O181_074015 [Austropuccinia psidii MF-1]|uniref:Reverse transcriptase Ty1/copia-type domain-containing protein n=1 Tax=Austropuccinia psidii MF-1 TaxID=1389203 RepID=A0A9Q3F3Q5_9BASI|nr:hypothetical protein [Austropuccinia psidii MF-1]
MQDAHSVSTPMDPDLYLSSASDDDHSLFLGLNVNYRYADGLISYLAISTRPNLAFPVSLLSQHWEKLGIQRWHAFKRLLRYLVGTQHLGLTLFCTDINIYTYADGSYANCSSTRRSYNGILVYLGNNLIHWKSQWQSSVSSSTEAEYKALYKGGQQIVWFRKLLLDMSLSISSPTLSFLGDNQPSIALAKNPLSSSRTMHINAQYHWLREQLVFNIFTLSYVSTMVMNADLLTTALHRVKHQGLVKYILSSSLPSAKLGG